MTRPRTVAEIPTPALVIALPAVEANIRLMARPFVLSLSKHEPAVLRSH